MDSLTPQFLMSIGVAVLCGGIVGLERQIRGKPAGIRTNILICLGTAIFVQLSEYVPR
jgi:putative Mg2+ transporter-C (MgtC) family protein